MNRKWLKVLVPEVAMVILTLAVFFLCRHFGLEDKEAAVAAAFAAFAVAAVAAAAVATAAVATVAAAAVATVVVFTAAAVVAVAAVAVAAYEYKLPIFWVIASYLVEAAVIFLPIYLSIS